MALADGDAVLAAIAWLAVLRVRAVHGLRDEASDGRLSGPTDPRQQVRVRDLPRGDRVPQRPRDVLLPDDRAERLGTVAAVESSALRHLVRIEGRPAPPVSGLARPKQAVAEIWQSSSA